MKKETKSEISFEFEKTLYGDAKIVCGVDEAGRGPLAGRVYAAAVILPENYEEIPELAAINDSKKLTEKKRDELAEIILNLGAEGKNAALLAMQRAIDGLYVKAEFALIDGNKTTNIKTPCTAVIGGDAKCPSIAAASILAKTERDKYCYEYLDKEFPEYGFAKHKGYGTKVHYEAVDKYGLCKEHRPSFFKKYFDKK